MNEVNKDNALTISLDRDRVADITAILIECRCGYAANFLRNFVKATPEVLDDIYAKLNHLRDAEKQKEVLDVLLSRDNWGLLYHCINAVIYEMGPEELTTITSRYLEELLSTNRIIFSSLYERRCVRLWDTDLKAKWAEKKTNK